MHCTVKQVYTVWFFDSVADPGYLSRILIFTHPGSRISGPGSKNSNKRQGWNIFFCQTIFCRHKFHKTEYYFIFDMLKKTFGPIFQELLKFLPKKLSPSPQKYGFGIRDPRSGKNLFRIQGSKRHRIPDPDPQHWFFQRLNCGSQFPSRCRQQSSLVTDKQEKNRLASRLCTAVSYWLNTLDSCKYQPAYRQ